MHPAHLNFFKNSILELKKRGHDIKIIVLNRGKVPKIVKRELPDIEISIVGKHTGTISSIIVQANFLRFFKMFREVNRFKPDIGFSVGSFILGLNMKLKNKPNFQFDDDPERSVNVFLEKITSSRLFFPMIYSSKSRKVKQINTLKEWSYLSPRYFVPNEAILNIYGLSKKKYIFVREVSSGSLNYSNQAEGLVSRFSSSFPKGYKVVLSLENKKNIKLYPSDWIILEEPVKDIHSLIYFSKLVISSGDSMAREGAMLGVPSIYCGTRIMKANQVLENENMLFHLQEKIPEFIKEKLLDNPFSLNQEDFRKKLLDKWTDVNLILLNLVDENLN